MQSTARNSTSYCDFQNRASPNRGDIINWTHPAGFTITNQIDDNQRISEIDSSLNDSTYPGMLAHMTYKPWGALATLLNGCAGTGCVQTQETYDYNNRLQLVRIQLGTATNVSANYCLVYNYYAGVANPTTCTASPTQAATGDNGNVMGYLYLDPVNTTLQHSVAYTFDGVNRLASATAKDLSSNTLWTQSYIFTTDSSNGQYGNMTCMVGGSGYCPQVTFSSSTNRVSQIGSLSASFDAAGNMTSDGTHTYQWDAAGRMVSVDSGSTATYKYNALGQRVERFLTNGSWTFDYLFGTGGEELGLYSAGTAAWFDQNVPMGRRVLVMYGSPLRMLHANKLGTTTVVTDQTGAELGDMLYYPWGQVWTNAGLPYDRRFAGMKQFESPEQLYPTDFRKYNPALGRWMTPDPLGGDVTNPQSLNRYAYALNNPATFNDPLGLKTCGGNGPTIPNDVDALSWCRTHIWLVGGSSPSAFFSNTADEFDLLNSRVAGPGAVLEDGGCLGCQTGAVLLGLSGIGTPNGGVYFGGGVFGAAKNSIGSVLDEALGPSLRQPGESVRACTQRVGNAVFGKRLNNAMVLTSIIGLVTLPTFGAEIYPTQVVPGVVYKGSLLETTALQGTGSGLRVAQISTAAISKVVGPLFAVSSGVELALAVDCR